MAVSTVEEYGNCELRCYRSDTFLCIGLFGNDKPISRILKAESREDTVDEVLFTWLGPFEDIYSPWSDNDNSQCQVITVDILRKYAKKY